MDKAIIAENCLVGDNTTFGIGIDIPNKLKPAIYSFGLVAVGEKICNSGWGADWKEHCYQWSNIQRRLPEWSTWKVEKH